MNTTRKILEDYENGDTETRLGLFLCHRNLRDAFMEIEMRESGAALVRKPGEKKERGRICLSVFSKLKTSLCSVLFGWKN